MPKRIQRDEQYVYVECQTEQIMRAKTPAEIEKLNSVMNAAIVVALIGAIIVVWCVWMLLGFVIAMLLVGTALLAAGWLTLSAGISEKNRHAKENHDAQANPTASNQGLAHAAQHSQGGAAQRVRQPVPGAGLSGAKL